MSSGVNEEALASPLRRDIERVEAENWHFSLHPPPSEQFQARCGKSFDLSVCLADVWNGVLQGAASDVPRPDAHGDPISPAVTSSTVIRETDSWALMLHEHDPAKHAHIRTLTGFDGSQIAAEFGCGLKEQKSQGKSGDFFFVAKDVPACGPRVLIKSVEKAELDIWLCNMERYISHLEATGGRTLLMPVLALGSLEFKAKHGRQKHVLHMAILGNTMRSVVPRRMEFKWDLKGHTVNRSIADEDLVRGPSITRKDGEFEAEGRTLQVSAPVRHLVLETVERDTEYLKDMIVPGKKREKGVMDYSLLVGMQTVEEADGDVPAAGEIEWGSSAVMCAPDGRTRYYLAIIDTATPYTTGKGLQNLGSFMCKKKDKGSAIPPAAYAERLVELCERIFEANDPTP